MPQYAYLCDSCGHETMTSTRGDRARCSNCGASGARRRFGFRVQTPFQDHFNMAIGRPVSNRRQFEDGLKKASEEATRKTGIEHDFQPVDAGDREAAGITDAHLAGLEADKKRRADKAQAGILTR